SPLRSRLPPVYTTSSARFHDSSPPTHILPLSPHGALPTPYLTIYFYSLLSHSHHRFQLGAERWVQVQGQRCLPLFQGRLWVFLAIIQENAVIDAAVDKIRLPADSFLKMLLGQFIQPGIVGRRGQVHPRPNQAGVDVQSPFIGPRGLAKIAVGLGGITMPGIINP